MRWIELRNPWDVIQSAIRGGRLSLIGPNGTGKSTLLRAMTGVYEPVKGTIAIRGRTAALLDLTLGIDPKLSGRGNV